MARWTHAQAIRFSVPTANSCAAFGWLCHTHAATAGVTECATRLKRPSARTVRRSACVVPLGQVETTPEQLAQSSQLAERATAATGCTTRVIGWYHSHPHITVLPSAVGAWLSEARASCRMHTGLPRVGSLNVASSETLWRPVTRRSVVLPDASALRADVRTQSTYQRLDEGFVGLIFSVFDEDRAKVRLVLCTGVVAQVSA